MKIGFWHDILPEHYLYFKDGLFKALEILKKDFEIKEFEDGDIIILWTGSYGQYIEPVKRLKGKKIWLYAGGDERNCGFDITVVEDNFALRNFKKLKVRTERAFGINTDLFRPLNLDKKWKIIFPAAYARYKRHSLLIKWVKEAGIEPKKVLTVGYKQPNRIEEECYKICEEAGFDVKGLKRPEELAILYNQSEECWIPSETYGGSQRTLMEALACGLKVRVAEDNPRLKEMLKEPIFSHYDYASKLKELCLSLL